MLKIVFNPAGIGAGRGVLLDIALCSGSIRVFLEHTWTYIKYDCGAVKEQPEEAGFPADISLQPGLSLFFRIEYCVGRPDQI